MRRGASVLSLVIVAACRGATTDLPHPTVPNLESSASDAASPIAAPSVSAAPSATAAFEGPMKSPVPSAMLADLEGLGLDPRHLPPLSKLEPQKLRKVMPLFAKFLGIKCAGCHADDNAAPTPRKRVAEKMWNEFAGKLTLEDGSPLFCDSCHQGRVQQLDRRDKKALGKWMEANFVGKLALRDGTEHDCTTCHGEEQKMHFIDMWKKG
jgi:hypothetical protein